MQHSKPTNHLHSRVNLKSLGDLIAQSCNPASLAVFRIFFGLIMVLEALALFSPSQSTAGQVMLDVYFTGAYTGIHFPYPGFEWLPLLPESQLRWVVIGLGVAGAAMATGLFYRLSACAVFLCWGYLYAVESTRTYWMSYYYLELLVAFILIFAPAARALSLDRVLFKKQRPDDQPIPFWPILLLRLQLVVTYFYAGLAKINRDWLVEAQPVKYFLAEVNLPTSLDSVEAMIHSVGFAYFISWAGALFDLLIGFLLLWPRSRMFGFCLVLVFHGTNGLLIFNDILYFPLLGVLSTSIFFPPDWPHRLRMKLRKERSAPTKTPKSMASVPQTVSRFTVGLVGVFLAFQILMPLRHYAIPGDARFTFEGLPFSWRLKAEVYRAKPVELNLGDNQIISKNPYEGIDLHWDQWPGDAVIYRHVDPSQIHWEQLPEIMVLSESNLGERILFNPLASPEPDDSYAAAGKRLSLIWKEAYGRNPTFVRKLESVETIATGFAEAIAQKSGQTLPAEKPDLTAQLKQFGAPGNGSGLPVFRRLPPFTGKTPPPEGAPFLLVNDSDLLEELPNRAHRVRRRLWQSTDSTRGKIERNWNDSHQNTLVLYTDELDFEGRLLFPDAIVLHRSTWPNSIPRINWNYVPELGPSKGMHISNNPFLLRRYARNVADRWQTQTGHRPTIQAHTAISLNFRHFQSIIRPETDLASVPVRILSHNPWIYDLDDPEASAAAYN